MCSHLLLWPAETQKGRRTPKPKPWLRWRSWQSFYWCQQDPTSRLTNWGSFPIFCHRGPTYLGAYLVLPSPVCDGKYDCKNKVLLGDAKSWAHKNHAMASSTGASTPQQADGTGGTPGIPEKATNSQQWKKNLTFLTGSLWLPPKCWQGKYVASQESAEVRGKSRGGHERGTTYLEIRIALLQNHASTVLPSKANKKTPKKPKKTQQKKRSISYGLESLHDFLSWFGLKYFKRSCHFGGLFPTEGTTGIFLSAIPILKYK